MKMYLQKVEIDYNVMIDGKNFFDQAINSEFKTCQKIRKSVRLFTRNCKNFMSAILLSATLLNI